MSKRERSTPSLANLPCAPSLFDKEPPWELPVLEAEIPGKLTPNGRELALDAAKEMFQAGQLGATQYSALLRQILVPQKHLPWNTVSFAQA